MGNTKIQIAEKKINGDWCNIKTVGGKDVSVNMKSAPKTAELINNNASEIEVNIVEKDGKIYGWDKQEPRQGGNKFQLTPEQLAAKQQREDHTQRMIIAQSSLSNACVMYGQGSKTPEQIMEVAKSFYNWVLETSK